MGLALISGPPRDTLEGPGWSWQPHVPGLSLDPHWSGAPDSMLYLCSCVGTMSQGRAAES